MSELQQSLEFLVSRLVHDLKNPLAVILSNLRFLKESISGLDEGEALVESLLSADRLDRMLDDAVDLGRMRRGTIVLASAPVLLRELEPALLEKLELLAGTRKLELDLDQPRPLLTDRTLLLRLMINVIEHALRQTPSRGTVRVQGASAPDGLTLRVVDGGAPFAPDSTPSFLDDELPVKRSSTQGCRSDQGLGLHFAGVAARALGARTELGPRPDGEHGVVFELVFPEEMLA